MSDYPKNFVTKFSEVIQNLTYEVKGWKAFWTVVLMCMGIMFPIATIIDILLR